MGGVRLEVLEGFRRQKVMTIDWLPPCQGVRNSFVRGHLD